MREIIDEGEKLDLDQVFKDLSEPSLIRNSRVNKEFHTFANLLGRMHSFSSRVNSHFKKIISRSS